MGTATENYFVAPKKAKFTIIASTDNGYVVKFWDWNPNTEPEELLTKFQTDVKVNAALTLTEPSSVKDTKDQYYYDLNVKVQGDQFVQQYFLFTAQDLENSAVEFYSWIQPTGGTVILPFKLRGDKTFTTDVSISGMVGPQFVISRNAEFSVSILGGIGMTLAHLTPENTTDTTVVESTDRAALGFSAGLVFQWKMIQLGFFSGADLLTDPKYGWKYNNKPWFGMGLGVALFTKEINVKEGNNTVGE